MNVLKYASLVLLTCLQLASAARILAFMPFPWRSHQNIFRPLMKALALKGHQVDFYTPLPMKDPPETLNQFVITDWHDEALGLIDQSEWETFSHFDIATRMSEVCIYILEKTFTHDQPCIDLLKSNQTYDAVITEFPIFSEGTIYLSHMFKGVHIAVLGYFDNPWFNEISGLPDNPSYMVSYANGFSDKMTFSQRLYNLYTSAQIVLSAAYATLTHQQAWADKRLRYEGWESRPKIMEMISETALFLMNSHVSSGHPYPKAPHVKEISGTHVAPEPLPKDLQDFMDDAPHGVIFFSLGSVIKPGEILAGGRFEIILSVFKSLKQKVMWKIGDGLPPVNDPKIKVQKWFPQQGILYHKNIKLFITHGGLQSTVEAISAGVPCLGMPFLFDQKKDVAFMKQIGMGLELNFDNLTEANLKWSINELLTNPKYLERAQKQKELFHDRPRRPVDEAVYWIEYVIRHGPILRPASAKMPFYQLYLLDVMGFIFACAGLAFWVMKRTIRIISRLVCPSTKPDVLQSKKKN